MLPSSQVRRHPTPRPAAGSALALALALVVALTGCTPRVSDRDYAGSPIVTDGAIGDHPGLPTDGAHELAPPGGPADGPFAALLDEGRVLAVVTMGSSSCPSVATGVEWRDTGALLRFASGGGAVCTADMAAHTHEFAVPAELRGHRLELELRYDGWDGVDRLVVG